MSVFCEKCGNKLEDGFAFCDKCGAKVESKKKEEKKEEKVKEEKVKEEKVKEEKVKVEDKPIPPEPPKPPKHPKEKKKKGKAVFLTILFIILLAAAVTFLILWLTKSTDCKCNNTSGGGGTVEPDPKPEPKKTYVGKWEQNVEYRNGSKVTQRTYGMIELKKDGTFESVYYDKDDKENTLEEVEGTYKVSGNTITFEYKSYGSKEKIEATVEDNKLCMDDDCEDYLVKDGNNKIIIYDDTSAVDIDTITYSEYEEIQKNYEDAIVVVIRDGCSWCEKFESVVEEIYETYDTPIYYYKSDGKIKINGTPTTMIIRNGYVVDSVEGYKDFKDMKKILDDLGIE